ncbi:Ulp1 protease family, C-terminal catalytic domain-containing protein [Theileria equi strain WA]|uniref:Ulp1 protease family, C-terminal catalytic domain-containing protein n=1 Tax=Theileria equi strain WA TaxID=1537102 RepID=L0B1N2_THEEQ|nr:Ulp1 protease family, C-terminal catalytic domain-containing protein [Theileria equi strain WA]AFZ81034.1 Ulp1 protease family, C-terminal catalytic domain-containing protein [Theileria equi strain WA]|eukprot:XP_004830700.1 Ulp1 protease family, C-terminal catalytic domain-containing protein [Theileria equi strain WA]
MVAHSFIQSNGNGLKKCERCKDRNSLVNKNLCFKCYQEKDEPKNTVIGKWNRILNSVVGETFSKPTDQKPQISDEKKAKDHTHANLGTVFNSLFNFVSRTFSSHVAPEFQDAQIPADHNHTSDFEHSTSSHRVEREEDDEPIITHISIPDREDISSLFSSLKVRDRDREIENMQNALKRYKSAETKLDERLRKVHSEVVKDYDVLPKVGDSDYDLWSLRGPEHFYPDGLSGYLKVLFMGDSDNNRKIYTEDQVKNTLELVRNSNPDVPLMDKFGITITKNTLSCLHSSNWLDDEVINFYLQMLQERNDKHIKDGVPNIPNCYFFNTFFFNALSGGDMHGVHYNYKAVARWTKRKGVDVFKKDLLIIPVHVSKVHWALGVVEMRSKWRRIMLFDSLGGSNSTWFSIIQQWLQDEHLDKLKEPLLSIDEWEIPEDFTCEQYAPEQYNSYDCGVFLCQFAECISIAKEFDFSQEKIERIRNLMIHQIVSGTLI